MFLFFNTSVNDWVLQFDWNQESNPTDGDLSGYTNELNRNFGLGAITNLYNSPNDIITPHYNFENRAGVVEIDLRNAYTLLISGTSATGGEHLGTYMMINGVETQIIAGQGSFPSANPFAPVITTTVFNLEVFIPEDAEVAFYDRWTFSTLNSNHSWSILPGAGSVNDHFIDLQFVGYNENSFSDTYNVFDSFNHILEVINNGTNLLVSDFWSNIGDEIYITNGYKIRNFEDKSVIASFQDLFDKWSQHVLGLGYAVYDDSGTFKVLIEKYEEFYKDVEIDYFDSIQDGSFNIEVDKDVIFNDVKIGYKEFAKSTDENKSSNVDDFNTEHTYLTPIETAKKDVSYISEVISSGYKIENQRLEQFKEIPKDTVSDDEKEFAIKGISSDEYSSLRMTFSVTSGPTYFIDINATFLNLSIGDVITISDTVSNNKSFTIEDIDLDLAGNTDFKKGVRLEVTESTTSEVDVTGVTLTKASAFLRAERDEAFSILSGVSDSETIYNGGLNPKYMLFNQSPILNSGFNPKPGTDEIKAQDVKLNNDAQFQFAVGEGAYIRDPNRETVTMDGDLTLSQLNDYNKLFNGLLYKFTVSVGYDRVLSIRDAYLNQSGSGDNFGYIRFDFFNVATDSNEEYRGYLVSMTYDPLNEQTEFILKGQG